MTRPAVSVFIDPFSPRLGEDRLFDRAEAGGTGDNAFEPFAYLREWLQARRVEVHTADLMPERKRGESVDIFLSLGLRRRFRRLERRPDVVLSAFFAFECPVVLPALYGDLHRIGQAFRRVYSFSTEEALRPFLRGPVELTRFMLPQSFDDVHQGIWERRDRKFLVMINANKLTKIRVNELYTDRLRALEFFNRYDEIDLYGLGWNQPPLQLGRPVPRAVQRLERRATAAWERLRPPADPLRVAVRESYRGPTDHKDETLGAYAFALCFENSVLDGWITEKIFDCFYAGTVPVYWGAPDIEDWVPPECFVDMRAFADYAELREFLHSRSPEEIQTYRAAARDFLRSERYRPFSKETFAERVGRIVEEDAGVSL